jgi:hypothetical protein
VVVERHGQVIGNQILGRDAQVHGIPVLELLPEGRREGGREGRRKGGVLNEHGSSRVQFTGKVATS